MYGLMAGVRKLAPYAKTSVLIKNFYKKPNVFNVGKKICFYASSKYTEK